MADQACNEPVTSGGFNVTFCAIVCILFVFLYDVLMLAAEAPKSISEQ
jgi:hypothetical protein